MRKCYLFPEADRIYSTGAVAAALLSVMGLESAKTILPDEICFIRGQEDATEKVLAYPKAGETLWDSKDMEEHIWDFDSGTDREIAENLIELWGNSDTGELAAAFLVIELSKLYDDLEFIFLPPRVNDQLALAIARDGSIPVQLGEDEGTSALTMSLLTAIGTFVEDFPIIIPEKSGVGEWEDDKSCKTKITTILEKETAVEKDHIAELSCNLDDCTGEQLSFAMEQLFLAGAKDVSFIPLTMKKNRPGTMMVVLCEPDDREKMCKLLFQHTSTIGVRWCLKHRLVMNRENVLVQTPLGTIETKECTYKEIRKTTVEYESAKKAALAADCSIEDVIRVTHQCKLS